MSFGAGVNAKSLYLVLGVNAGEFNAKLNAAALETERAGASMSRSMTRHSLEAEASMRRLQGTAVAFGKYLTMSVVGTYLASAKAAADFAEKQALVNTLAHSNAKTAAEFRKAAMDTGTAYGYTATQVSDAEAELVKAGVKTKDILGGALKGTLTLAAAGQTDVATATEYAAAAMTQFRLKGKDVPHIADLLAAGADKALGSVTDLGYGLSQAGTTAHQAGLDIEDTVGTLAAFAQAGLTGERGGTVFKQMLMQLMKPTKQSQALMDEYGLSLYNANGQMKSMPEIAGNIQKAFKDLTPQQRNFALATIFGSRAVQGANILMAEGSKGIQDWIDKVNDQGFAAHQASGKLDSLKGDLQKLKAEGLDALIELGSGSQAPLRELVENITHWLHQARQNGDLKKWGKEAEDTLENIAQVGKKVGDGLIPVAHGVGKIIDGFAKLPDGLQKVIIGGAAVGYLGKKTGALGVATSLLGGKGGNALTGGGGILGRSGVVPVYVLNWPGSLGGGVPSPGPGGGGRVPIVPVADPRAPKTSPYEPPKGDLRKVWAEFQSGTTEARSTMSRFFGSAAGEGVFKTLGRGLLAGPAWMVAGGGGMRTMGNPIYPPGMGPDTPASKVLAYWRQQIDQQKAAKQASSQQALGSLILNPSGDSNAIAAGKTQVQLLKDRTVETKKASTAQGDLSKKTDTTVAAVAALAKAYHLTPARVKTAIEAAGLEKATSGVMILGREYGLTPKEVKTLIEQAGMDTSQKNIKALARQYDLTPHEVRTLITVDASSALVTLAKIRREIQGIHDKSFRITGYVNRVNAGNKHRALPGNPDGLGADGATVPKTGLPYADRWLYGVADGEEIVSDRHGQATRYRPVLKAISANRPRHVIRGMLADGGTAGHVGRSSYVSGHPSHTVIVQQTLPDQVRLVVDGKSFTAYVQGHAESAARSHIAAARVSDNSLERMNWS